MPKTALIFFLCVLCVLCGEFFFINAAEDENTVKATFAEGVSIYLCEPTFSNGVFTTEKGGVINAPNLRIQARHLQYIRKLKEEEPQFTLMAEGDLMIVFNGYFFVGERLEYDFQGKSGYIINGRTGTEPWYVGGKTIRLFPDGSYIIDDAFITTDDNICPDWKIAANRTKLCEQRYVEAKDVRFRFFNTTLFWLPTFSLDLDTIFDNPISYSLRWGGREGPRVGMTYEVFSWEHFKTWLKLDYRLNRGPGGGIETRYRSEDRRVFFQTINYIARDNSIFLPSERLRYRFEGAFSGLFLDDTVSVDFTYDKLSDKYMATDYDDKGIELETAGRTQLDITRQHKDWIANLYSRVRINSFETVKQELPTLMNSWRPLVLGKTGIISDNRLKLSYMDFDYAHHLPDVHDFSAGRFAFSHLLYRPIVTKAVTVTPEAGLEAICYTNGPHGEDGHWLALGVFGCEINTPMYRFYNAQKHVFEPYASYHYYTSPTISPHKHYIFDIEDGWVRLNMVRFGARNSLYKRGCDGYISRYLWVDLYANAFIDIHTIPQTIQKVYADTVWRPNDFLKFTLCSAWNFQENQLDHANLRAQWTVNADFALAAEYRHRDAFDWRKADHTNFMLDAFHTVEELRDSPVSDRRDTFLVHLFYRFLPNWALEFESRHGWNRRHENNYTEFEVDLLTTIYSAGQMKLSYQHIEGDDRVAIYFSIGLKRPDSCSDCIIPFLDF